jgi:uncharacterized membrane protein YbhN (UPF0104 family)
VSNKDPNASRSVSAEESPPAAAAEPVDRTDPAAVEGTPADEPVSGWQRWARVVGIVILAAVTVYGVRKFISGDAAAVTAYWSKRYTILPLVMFFAAMDVLIEMTAWMWILERFGIRARDLTGAGVALSGKAGLLLPAQLGRLIRPDLLVRLHRATLAQGLKAEAVVFVLDSTSVLALFAALVAFRVHPALTPLAGLAVIGVTVFLGNRIVKILAGTRLELPQAFWWRWQTVAIVVLQSAGWIAHGLAFFVLASDLPGNVGMWDALFLAPGSAVLGIGSGLPGGIGATEALLGLSLDFNQVPKEHLALGVAAFRIVTFWLLLPVGWIALAWFSRRARRAAASDESKTDEEDSDIETKTNEGESVSPEIVPSPSGTSGP